MFKPQLQQPANRPFIANKPMARTAGGGSLRDLFGNVNQGSIAPPGSGMAQGSINSPIAAPQRVTVQQAYNNIKSLLPQFTPLQGIQNVFNDDYYKNLEGQATKRLNERFFTNDDAIVNQFKNTMAKRGLIGSGIEVGGLNDLYKNFGSELSDLQSKLATQKTENLFETTKYNKDIDKYNIETQNKLAELGLGAAGDEAKTSTDFATRMFDSAVKQRNADQTFISDQIKTINDALKNELIDQETRQYFESLFGTYMGDTFGQSFPEFNKAQDEAYYRGVNSRLNPGADNGARYVYVNGRKERRY